MSDSGWRFEAKRGWIAKMVNWFFEVSSLNVFRVFLATKAYKWRQKLPLFIGNEMRSWYVWNGGKFCELCQNFDDLQSVWNETWSLWVDDETKSFCTCSDAFYFVKEVAHVRVVPFWDCHEFHDMELTQEAEFGVPCLSLGQIKSTCAFWDILCAKWYPRGEESYAKRIKSRGCLSWKWHGWKVGAVTWNSRSGIRSTMSWAYFCAHIGILDNSKIDGLKGKIDV